MNPGCEQRCFFSCKENAYLNALGLCCESRNVVQRSVSLDILVWRNAWPWADGVCSRNQGVKCSSGEHVGFLMVRRTFLLHNLSNPSFSDSSAEGSL